MTLLFRLLAPYLAVAVFWCGLSNAWLAILAYHAQILLWARKDSIRGLPGSARGILPALPMALAGPLLYLIMPFITSADLPSWLAACFAVLTGVSYLWHKMAVRGGGLAVPALSHVLADLGVAVAAWLRT